MLGDNVPAPQIVSGRDAAVERPKRILDGRIWSALPTKDLVPRTAVRTEDEEHGIVAALDVERSGDAQQPVLVCGLNVEPKLEPVLAEVRRNILLSYLPARHREGVYRFRKLTLDVLNVGVQE